MYTDFLKDIEKKITHTTTIGTENNENFFIDLIPLQDIKIAKIKVIIVNILMFFIFGNTLAKNVFSAAVIHDAIIIPEKATNVLIALNAKPSDEIERKNKYIKKKMNEE